MQKKFYGLLVAGFATILAASQAQARLVQFGTIQDHKQVTCAAGNSCKLEFAIAGGAGKATYIEAMSCSIKVARNSNLKPVINQIQLNQSHQNGVHIFLAPLSAMEITGTDIKYQIYASGLSYMVPAGSKPQVIIDLSSNAPAGGQMTCAYTGKQDQ
jgi:hypothetical protein